MIRDFARALVLVIAFLFILAEVQQRDDAVDAVQEALTQASNATNF